MVLIEGMFLIPFTDLMGSLSNTVMFDIDPCTVMEGKDFGACFTVFEVESPGRALSKVFDNGVLDVRIVYRGHYS